ncbi:MAG: hypothetical protein ABF718_01590 [Leuconostoc pseudomesenteroides]|uniref:hypothetical protein n=1 Tax=Leuconostoc pseudomesenteroides TaxID=33968 RepID=UPI0039EAFB81
MTNPMFNEAKIKELIATSKVQDALKEMVTVPKDIIIKSVRSPFTNKETNETTQKVHAVSDTSLMDMVEIDLTLVGGETVDEVEAINKSYHIDNFNVALDANMRAGNFTGYSPTGLKILVTAIAETKTVGKQS